MWTVLSLIALPSDGYAQAIGTWSAERSPDPVATSRRYDEFRSRLAQDFPYARLVPIHTLSGPVLALLDVLLLDGAGDAALTADEADALLAFVRDGGWLIADATGVVGGSVAAPFGVRAEGEPHRGLYVNEVPAGTFAGPWGDARQLGTADSAHLAATDPAAVAVGDAHGAHLVTLPVGQGRAVFLGGLSALADPEGAGGRFRDNAALLMNLIARAMPAPRIGTWSAGRSPIGFARSDAFDVARHELRARMPGLAWVEIDTLVPDALAGLDAVLLDSMADPPPSVAEIQSLKAFVERGGGVAAQVYGPTGNALASVFELAVVGTPDPAARTSPITKGVRSPALEGPFGTVATYANRYEASIGTTNPNTPAIPLVRGSSGEARVVYVPPVGPRGAALMVTNLFAFGDPEWSVGGLADGTNDNVALLGNFLASTARPTPLAVPEDPGGWRGAYLRAANAAVRGDLGQLRLWMERHGADPAAAAVARHGASWLAAAPEQEPLVDPRFFPVEGIRLGETTRADLKRSGRRPNGESKWTFDVGMLTWTCVEGRQDTCDVVQAETVFPQSWSAVGIEPGIPPEELVQRFLRLGYRAEIGFASQSPFGRQVVASGFGLLWQADYSLREHGERMLSLTARRTR